MADAVITAINHAKQIYFAIILREHTAGLPAQNLMLRQAKLKDCIAGIFFCLHLNSLFYVLGIDFWSILQPIHWI